MTDQTACRPGTIARIPLPIGLYDLENALEPTHGDGRRVIGHGDHLDVFVPEDEEPPPSTSLTIPHDPKAIREALCLTWAALVCRYMHLDGADHAARVLNALIQECDRHRPLGPDGKHGDRHTATCGCDDVPERYQVAEAAQDGQERAANVPADSGACGGGCEAAGALRQDAGTWRGRYLAEHAIAEECRRQIAARDKALSEAHASLLVAVEGNAPLVKRAEAAEAKVARVRAVVVEATRFCDTPEDPCAVHDHVPVRDVRDALDGGTNENGGN